MKHIVKLIVENKGSLTDYVAQLSFVFRDAISILPFCMDDPDAYTPQKEEVVLTSAFSATDFREWKKTHLQGQQLIPINLCLPRRSLLRLNAYPKGTRALLVNVTKFMAEETIAQLYQAGYSHISFVPCYPGYDGPSLPLAVTPGEAALAPAFVAECLDLGPRQIDIVTMIELAVKIKCEYILSTRRFWEYFEKQYNTSAGVSILMEENQLLERRLSALMQLFPGGLAGIDANGEIFDCNFSASELLGRSRAQLLGRPASPLIPDDMLCQCRSRQLPVSRTVAGESGTACDAHLVPITHGTQYLGAYATLCPPAAPRTELRPRAGQSGHVAKYRFSDICGTGAGITRTVELAKKMARTESSILITGESGTGKELFAHAIHNSSPRSEAPFVAINCAALPDSLLESELFGYEEGAFTGARKGGKAGLFEMANTGSIFLDEIEGMAPSTQLKLLRVIQEREIMRVGGDRVIPIDVRIISASNEDLLGLMECGKFRSDLFYRVSTLPLNLPPLRQRREDILDLIEEFKSALRLTFVLTEDAKNILLRYAWPGNIRELRNCVEYMGCQNLSVIEPENLPFMIRTTAAAASHPAASASQLETELLRLLSLEPRGRSQLSKLLRQEGFSVSEGRLRRELEALKQKGYITSGVGRGGSRLTPLGQQEHENRLK